LATPAPGEEIRVTRRQRQESAMLILPRLSQTAELRSQTPWSFQQRDKIVPIGEMACAVLMIAHAFV
jgi:hypothetical protein